MRALAAAVFSFAFPGFGAGLARQVRAMWAWTAVSLALLLAGTVSIWIVALAVAVRVAAAVDGLARVRAAVRRGVRSNPGAALLAIAVHVAAILGLRIMAIEGFEQESSAMEPTLAIGDHVWVDKLSLGWRPVETGDVIVYRDPCAPDDDYLKRVVALGGQTVEVRCNRLYIDGQPVVERLVNGDDCSYDNREESAAGDLRWTARDCSEYAETAGTRTYHVLHDVGRPYREEDDRPPRRPDSHDFPSLDYPGAPSCPGTTPWHRAGEPPGQQPGVVIETKHDAGPCELQQHYVVPKDHVFVLGDNRPQSNDSRYWGSVPVDNIKGRVIGTWLTTERLRHSVRPLHPLY